MTRALADTRRWMQEGAGLLLIAIASLDDEQLSAPSALPGWSRRNLVAHLAANADALMNLMRWAATGVPTPMYASLEARKAGIERGAALPTDELMAWARQSSSALEAAMDAATEEHWLRPVVTAQGRTVPATEVPWMRAREVYVHAVDLDVGTAFRDLPTDYLAALCDEIVGKRSGEHGPTLELAAAGGQRWHVSGTGTSIELVGTVADIAAYLTGRAHGVTTDDGRTAPELPPWL